MSWNGPKLELCGKSRKNFCNKKKYIDIATSGFQALSKVFKISARDNLLQFRRFWIDDAKWHFFQHFCQFQTQFHDNQSKFHVMRSATSGQNSKSDPPFAALGSALFSALKNSVMQLIAERLTHFFWKLEQNECGLYCRICNQPDFR